MEVTVFLVRNKPQPHTFQDIFRTAAYAALKACARVPLFNLICFFASL